MLTKQLQRLCDIAEASHKTIQQDHQDIDPLIGVSQNMRQSGIPADVMSVDCLRSRKRIIFILHDHHPDVVRYQFTEMDNDPGSDFSEVALDDLTTNLFYHWVCDYFKAEHSSV